MRTRDNSQKIAQLNLAKACYELNIINTKEASERDGVDRSGAIASEEKCLQAIQRQLDDLAPKPEEKSDPMPIAKSAVPNPTTPPPSGIRATGGVAESESSPT